MIIDPVFYRSDLDYTFDFSSVRWPFGLFLILLCIGFIYSVIRTKSETTNLEDAVLMCRNCIRPVPEKDAGNDLCPICGGTLEKLEGFYDRHPELK